jgi:Skp family chaperone for outer membrane proteins
MKKFILAFILLLTASTAAFSQTAYPKFDTDSAGQKLVVLTIEQAQALDNNTDLILMFEKLNNQISNYDSVCLKVVDAKEKVIASQTIQINNLKDALQNKDQQLINLQATIDELTKKSANYEQELKNKNEEIGLHKKEIRRVKRNYILGGGIGGLILGIVLSLVLVH